MDKKPVMTPEVIELLEPSDSTEVPVQQVITIQLPREMLMRMALACRYNPTQYPQ